MKFHFEVPIFLLWCGSLYLLLPFADSSSFVSGSGDEAYFNRYHCIVTSPSGTYRGFFNASVMNQNSTYCSYRDIRYGKPPIGNYRFGLPILAKPLKPGFIYDATHDMVRCPQGADATLNASTTTNEDCLFLNVFSPYRGKNSFCYPLLPVIVWIPGGGFLVGSKISAQYSPDYFMPHGVVLVTVNYRLAALGFLNLNIPEAPGNQGLWDQLLALEWVQKNIRSFGGDPKKVTVMGQSAGAKSAVALLLTPKSRGLMHRVIVESSSILPVLSNTAVIDSMKFAEFLGYDGNRNNRRGMLRYLQGLSVLRLLNGYLSFLSQSGIPPIGTAVNVVVFKPSQDSNGPYPLFPDSEKNLGAKAPNIPCIFGYNSADGTVALNAANPYVYVNATLNDFGKTLSAVDPVFVKDNRTLKKVTEKMKAYFYNPRNKKSLLAKTIRLGTYVYNDKFYEQIHLFRKPYNHNNIFTYFFDYGGGYTDFKKQALGSYANEVGGAAHTEELRYLFYSPQFPPYSFQATKREYTLIEKMTTWWSNFARTGSPSSHCDSTGVYWNPITPTRNEYLWIRNSSEPVIIKKKEIDQNARNFFRYLRKLAQNY